MSEEEKILLLKTNLELSVKLEQANHVIEEWQKRYCKYRHYIIKEKSKRRKEDLIKENDVLKERIEEAIDYINKLEFEKYGVLYDNGTSIMEYEDNCKEILLEILKGDSNE